MNNSILTLPEVMELLEQYVEFERILEADKDSTEVGPNIRLRSMERATSARAELRSAVESLIHQNTTLSEELDQEREDSKHWERTALGLRERAEAAEHDRDVVEQLYAAGAFRQIELERRTRELTSERDEARRCAALERDYAHRLSCKQLNHDAELSSKMLLPWEKP